MTLTALTALALVVMAALVIASTAIIPAAIRYRQAVRDAAAQSPAAAGTVDLDLTLRFGVTTRVSIPLLTLNNAVAAASLAIATAASTGLVNYTTTT